MTAAPSGTFQTGDGLLNIAANKQTQFEVLCKIIEREDLLENSLYEQREARIANRLALKTEIEAALSSDSANSWAKVLNANGVPAGEVLNVASILEHEQVKMRGFVQNIQEHGGVGGDIKVVRSGFKYAS